MHPACSGGLLMCIFSCVFSLQTKWWWGWQEQTAAVTLQKQQWLCELVWLKLSSAPSLARGFPLTRSAQINGSYLSGLSCLKRVSLSLFPVFTFKAFRNIFSTLSPGLTWGHSASAAPTPPHIWLYSSVAWKKWHIHDSVFKQWNWEVSLTILRAW